jgi:hypothetical protein
MEATTTASNPIRMGTNKVWSWIDSYSDIIDFYTANGWKNGGEWYLIRLKSGQQLYGFDEEDNGSCCLTHEQWCGYDGWDIADTVPELYSYLTNLGRAAGGSNMGGDWLKAITKPVKPAPSAK